MLIVMAVESRGAHGNGGIAVVLATWEASLNDVEFVGSDGSGVGSVPCFRKNPTVAAM